MSDMITKQLIDEKKVLFDRVNMIEKDLTRARILLSEVLRDNELLRLRVEKLEKHIDKVFHI